MTIETESQNLVELPNMDNHQCFGCSPINPYGLQMKFFAEGDAVISWLIIPPHLCGWQRIVHGGIISTMLDEVMARAIIFQARRLGLTKSMTIRFLKPVYIGDKLKVVGKVKKITGDREANVKAYLYNNQGELSAASSGTFALVSATQIEQMGIADKEVVAWFEKTLNTGVVDCERSC